MIMAYIDDEPDELNYLKKNILELFATGTVFDTYKSSADFFKHWHTGKYDLIFLDIYIDNKTGIDIARKIRETDTEVLLVFCTTSNEFAAESYEVDARFYLQKPFTQENIKSMLSRFNLDALERQRTVTLSNGQCILPRHIIYTEYSKHVAFIHMCTSKTVSLRITQTELEDCLCAFAFFICCCKGILVNLYEVENITGDIIHMKNGDILPISRRKLKDVNESFDAFRLSRVRRGDQL